MYACYNKFSISTLNLNVMYRKMVKSFKESIHLFGIAVKTGKQPIYTFVYQKKTYIIFIILHREMV